MTSKVDIIFISCALIYLVLGISLGIGMGITENFAYAHVHAHINLLGWATLALYGLAHRCWPELRRSKLAVAQFWLAIVGTPVFLIGLPFAMFGKNPVGAVIGSLMIFAGVLCFLALFARSAWSAAALPAADLTPRAQPRGA